MFAATQLRGLPTYGDRAQAEFLCSSEGLHGHFLGYRALYVWGGRGWIDSLMPPEMKRHMCKSQKNSEMTPCDAGMNLLFTPPNPGTQGNKERPLEMLGQGGRAPSPRTLYRGRGLCFQLSVGRKTPFHLLRLGDPKAARATGLQTATRWCSLGASPALDPNLLINCDLWL